MNGTHQIQTSRNKLTRLLTGAAVAIALSVGVAADPAFADSGRRHSGWNHGNNHHGFQNWGHRGGNHWAYHGGPRWYSQPFAFRQPRYPAHRWNAFSHPGWNAFGHPGWNGYRHGHGGGASITLNVPFR